jgi:glutamyl-tRNA reductase
MSFLVIGINHRTAPVEIREKVVFAASDLPEALTELRRIVDVREAVVVSTCNRTEVYCYSGEGRADLIPWLLHWHELATHELEGCVYRYEGADAVRHLFAVAAGLDSMILGEPQILGQLKDAYREALDVHATGPLLNRLFQAAFSVAKRIRTNTRIGSSAVSVASAAVNLAHTVFDDFGEHTGLLIGAGDTIALAARHLHAHGLQRMIVANRSIERAQQLAAEFNGYAIPLDGLEAHLPDADIIISSTASPNVVLTYDAVRNALKSRKHKPVFMVDIAVPRDIDPRIAELEDVYLFTIDDLQNVVSGNQQARREAAREAGELLEREVEEFLQHLRTLDVAPAIRQIRNEAEALRDQTLQQAQRMLASGRDPRLVVDFLATTLTNRLLHAPSQRLRDAAELGDAELIAAARVLYGLDETDTAPSSAAAPRTLEKL